MLTRGRVKVPVEDSIGPPRSVHEDSKIVGEPVPDGRGLSFGD